MEYVILVTLSDLKNLSQWNNSVKKEVSHVFETLSPWTLKRFIPCISFFSIIQMLQTFIYKADKA